MTPKEIADRMIVCVNLMNLRGLADLANEHAWNNELALILRHINSPVLSAMVYLASPEGSLLEDMVGPHRVPHMDLSGEQEIELLEVHCLWNAKRRGTYW